MLAKKRLTIEINELLLEGFNQTDGKLISATLKQELTRLIKDNGLIHNPNSNVNAVSVNSLLVNVNINSNAKAIGIEIARCIYGGLK